MKLFEDICIFCMEHYWKIVVILALISVIGGLFVGCDTPPTQEQSWVRQQDQRCQAARGRGTYIKETKYYECWQKPAFRRPKIVFTEKYI